MHLLFISSLVPLTRPASGFDIANRVVVDALRAAGHRVSVLGFAPLEGEPSAADGVFLLGRMDVTTASAGLSQKLTWLGKAMVANTSFASAKMLSVSQAAFTAALEEAGPVDGYILNSVQLPAAFLPLLDRRPSIYLAHNIEHRSAAENAAAAQGLVERLMYRRESRQLKRLEDGLARAARHVWTLSDADRAEFERDGHQASVLPLVTSVTPPEKTVGGAAEYDLGLIGTWTWQPNRIGLVWFLNEIVPQLSDDVTIHIAGKIGDQAIACSHPGVRFVGRVPDARAFVEKARVVPLASRGGTGVQLKTIETFELGMPAVATSSALRGISAVPENCDVADEPAAIAAALQRMIEDVRASRVGRIDGSRFHQRQLDGLHAALKSGLETLGRAS